MVVYLSTALSIAFPRWGLNLVKIHEIKLQFRAGRWPTEVADFTPRNCFWALNRDLILRLNLFPYTLLRYIGNVVPQEANRGQAG